MTANKAPKKLGRDTAVTMDHPSGYPSQCDLNDSDYGDEGSYERSNH